MSDQSYADLLADLRRDLQLDAMTDLAPGSFDQAALTFARPARAFRAAAWTVPTTPTVLALDTVSFNPFGNFDVTTNHRYNVATTGYYLVTATFGMAVTASSGQVAEIFKNGVVVNSFEVLAGVSANESAGVTDIILCKAGDFLDFRPFAGTAGAGDTGSTTTWMAVARIA